MTGLRILTEEGIQAFRDYINTVRQVPDARKPDLNAAPYSRPVDAPLTVDQEPRFSTRLEMGRYLVDLFRDAGAVQPDPREERGLWTWLAYLWFDILCPLTGSRRRVKDPAYYICTEHFRRDYRHLVASSYRIHEMYGDDPSIAGLLLGFPPHKHNEFVEKLASRQYLLPYRNIMQAAALLYWDDRRGRPKRGAQSSRGPGVPERFATVIQQLELTYDVFHMDPGQILDLLPAEFDRWRPEGHGSRT